MLLLVLINRVADRNNTDERSCRREPRWTADRIFAAFSAHRGSHLGRSAHFHTGVNTDLSTRRDGPRQL